MFLALIFYLVILCQIIDDQPADFPVVTAKYKPSAVPYNFKADPLVGEGGEQWKQQWKVQERKAFINHITEPQS